MDFLNKLYESNYFGIGLFAVISFLVVTFLIVLFFGKKDEKKRKLEATNKDLVINNETNTFADTSSSTKVEVPIPVPPIETPIAPVMPVEPVVETPTTMAPEPAPVASEPITEPIIPTFTKVDEIPQINEIPSTPINNNPIPPVAPLNYEEPVVTDQAPMYTPPVPPVVNEPVISTPVEPVTPTITEPTTFNIPTMNMVEPQVTEPVIIEPTPVVPEEVTPIIKEEEQPLNIPEEPIIEEPTIGGTYYQPVEPPKPEPVTVPNIDFDAIAKSISKELDELEKSNTKVTPMNEVIPENHVKEPNNNISSIYVNSGVKSTRATTIDMPKKIDLPTKKIN